MARIIAIVGILSGGLFVLAGCSGDRGRQGPPGETGTAGTPGAGGLSGLVVLTVEAAGVNCPDGGQKIESGLDDNSDGTLQAGEVDTTTYVCDGSGGLQSLVAVTDEPAGVNCENGGKKIETGVDDDDDGTLQAGEVDDTAYVCDGSDAADTGLFDIVLENLVVSAIEVTNTAGAVTVAFHVEDEATGAPFTQFGEQDDNVRGYLASHVPAGRPTVTTYTDTASPVTTWDTSFLERWAYQRNRNRPDDVFVLDISDSVNGNYSFTMDATTASFTALEAGTSLAVDYVAGDTQRLFLRVDGRDFGYNRAVGILDFVVPADTVATTGFPSLTRVIVDRTACESCHNNPLERAAHGGGYQTPQGCNICHSPIGNQYGDRMQNHETWAAKLFHQLHSAIPNAAHPDRIDGTGYAAVRFPGDVKNCVTCHFDNGQDLADNWKSNPTAQVCSSCHTTVILDGVTAYTQLNGDTHTHDLQTNNDNCSVCHTDTGAPPSSGDTTDIVTAHIDPPRTMTATITDVDVDAGNGNVTVFFSVADDGTPVTVQGDFDNNMAFTLARLEEGTGGASNHWESYTARFRTKDPLQAPVVQGYSESSADGTFVNLTGGDWSYTFGLVNANTPGDITSDMATAVNVTNGIGGAFDPGAGQITTGAHTGTFVLGETVTGGTSGATANVTGIVVDTSFEFAAVVGTFASGEVLTGGTSGATATSSSLFVLDGNPTTYPNVVIYDETLTHRVGMMFTEADGTDNLTNATFDFVPDGTSAMQTREIVTMDKCNDCHNGRKLHKGYALELCATCHNQSTFDPFTGDDPATVDLQTMIHKLHMGFYLPSVVAGGTYSVNQHDFSNLITPQPPNNCRMCHDDSNVDGENWKHPRRRACGACHDSEVAAGHIAINTDTSGPEVESCAVCHGEGRIVPIEDVHIGISQ